ncbi:MAG: MMPL family transporter [Nanobdellota archaeon]
MKQKKRTNPTIDKYASFVVKYPWIMIIIAIILTGVFLVLSQQVDTVTASNQDALPDNVPVIEAFDTIESKFGGSDSAKIVFMLEQEEPYGIDDIRDPAVLEKMEVLEALLMTVENVQNINSPLEALERANDGVLPKTYREAIDTIEATPQAKSYYSDDYSMVMMTLMLDSDYDSAELFKDLQETTSQVIPPEGVIIKPAGEVLAQAAIMESIGGDMSKTSMFSLIGIVIVLLLVFRSVRFAAVPLVTIGMGVILTMGYLGLIGINLSSTTSGVISMIMGIGIDFGIQIVTRFRQEMRTEHIETSMRKTLNAVFKPMTTTTIAAIIGFKAMGLGKITFLAEMGEIMSYGVAGCYFAALILIPGLLVLYYTVFETKSMKAARA